MSHGYSLVVRMGLLRNAALRGAPCQVWVVDGRVVSELVPFNAQIGSKYIEHFSYRGSLDDVWVSMNLPSHPLALAAQCELDPSCCWLGLSHGGGAC